MRHVGRGKKLQTVASGLEYFVIGQRPRRAIGEVVDHHDGADETANGLSSRRHFQPFVQGAALVGLEVAEADPAQFGGIKD